MCVLLCCRWWLGSLWRGLTEAFSDNSSQSSFTTTSTDPRKLVTMLDAIATNLSDMFKVGDDSCNYCLWQLLGYSVSQLEKLKGCKSKIVILANFWVSTVA